ncbi:phytanoyl-CoA dioxygenase family protein [Nitzschia inconspicua]|uniref:Phytanoyl-CoA dioxygenase family protein n=1 Tax=Nitzschia inconspicua TaxID=303405 RepID=A0A9K3M8E7_9STRA|nr:phytanoyl-CoA dioxygenase family protein [Nitzschia inconspicua]
MNRRFSFLLFEYAAIALSCQLVLFDHFSAATPPNNSDDVDEMKNVFEKDGYLLLRKIFEKQELSKWESFASQQFDSLFQRLYENGVTKFPEHARMSSSTGKIVYAMEEGSNNGYSEIVMRSPGRYELSIRNTTSRDTPMALFDTFVEQLSPFLPKFLHRNDMSDINMSYSLIVSTPGASHQSWHTDSEHLSMEEHLPCHCLNVFIPLVNVSPRLGPTEIIPGSHFMTRQPTPYQIPVDPANPARAPTLKLGDAIVFDCRLMHHDKSNVSDQNRPVLALTFSQPTYHDTKSWPERSIFPSCDETEPTCAAVL